MGGTECKGGALAAGYDENTVFFTKKNAEVAEKIKTFLEHKLSERLNGTTATQQLSPADELKKFKELLDMGVITQEEFNAKKKDILGL